MNSLRDFSKSLEVTLDLCKSYTEDYVKSEPAVIMIECFYLSQ